MRVVEPKFEYTFVCLNCKTRYALGPSEYNAHLGQFFTCKCNSQTKLIDFDVLTYEVRKCNDVQNLLVYDTK